MKKKYLFFLTLVILTSCSQPVKEVYIDNPSSEKLTIKFDDGEVITIEPYLSTIKKLKYGKRKIKVNNRAAEEINLEKEYEYLLNPLKATYYIEKAKYFTSTKASVEYYKNHPVEKSKIDNIEVNGDFTEIANKILIKKTWKLGLDEELTANARGYTTSRKGYITGSKIHRKKDLLDKIMSQIREEFGKMQIE